MKFNFPKPKSKKTAWLSLDNDIWTEIWEMRNKLGITEEQILSTIITDAWRSAYPVIEHQNKKDLPAAVSPVKDDANPSEAVLPAGPHKPKHAGGERWTTKHPTCTNCGKNDTRHQGQGLCSRCYYKHRKTASQGRRPLGKWALKHDFCASCGSTDKKHMGKGLCSTCYFKPQVKADQVKAPDAVIEQAKADSIRIRAERENKYDAEIKSKILICECPNKEKIVKGCEKKYKNHIFYSDRCIEWFVNKDTVHSPIADILDEIEPPSRELNLNAEALKYT